MPWQHPELTFRPRRNDFVHLLAQELLLRGHDL